MITATEALTIVNEHALDLSSIDEPLEIATGKMLRESLYADRDFPPYNRVTMDGIAFCYADYAKGQKTFPIEGVGAAGAPQQKLTQTGHCLEIMTGAILPIGTDTVVRYEDIFIKDQQATLQVASIRQGQNIHRQGEDRKQGDLIVPAGQKISAAEIGVAATIGKTHLKVARPISALILSSGDELVKVFETPLPHQIRRSNVYTIQALLQKWGITVSTAHVPDDKKVIEQFLAEGLPQHDVLLLSGGVSKGKFDYIPDALEALGVERLFHRVAQRPGKPFWFGRIPGGTLVFALPGNPVSSLVCTTVYFRHWLETSWGINQRPSMAQLTKDVHFKPDLSYFLQVHIHTNEAGLHLAEPIEGHGSGDLANLVEVDAFLQLPQGKVLFKAGEAFPVWKFR